MVVSSQELKLDDVTYRLQVRSEVTGYFASFFCQTCGIGGVKYELQPTIEDAMKVAAAGAEKHHLQHRQATGPA